MKFITILKLLVLVYTIYVAVVNDFWWLYLLPILVLVLIVYSWRKTKYLNTNYNYYNNNNATN